MASVQQPLQCVLHGAKLSKWRQSIQPLGMTQ